jgi:hypothetical protein
MMDTKTRELAFSLSHGFCRCSADCVKQATEIHHMLANTQTNRAKYPLFIDSIFNLCPINHDCHMSKPVPRVTDREAQVYEEWLGLTVH